MHGREVDSDQAARPERQAAPVRHAVLADDEGAANAATRAAQPPGIGVPPSVAEPRGGVGRPDNPDGERLPGDAAGRRQPMAEQPPVARAEEKRSPVPASGRLDFDLAEQATSHPPPEHSAVTRAESALQEGVGPARSARTDAAALVDAISAETSTADATGRAVADIASTQNPGTPHGGQAQPGAAREGYRRAAARANAPAPAPRMHSVPEGAGEPGAARHASGARVATGAEAAVPIGPAHPRAAQAVAAFHAASVLALHHAPTVTAAAAVAQAIPAAILDQELPTQIVQAVHMQWGRGGGEARVKLLPGFLGGLDISVQVEGASVSAALTASTPEVRDWMRTNEPALRQALAEQGLTLDRLVIVDEDAPPAEEHERGADRRPDQETPRRPRRPSGQHTFELVV